MLTSKANFDYHQWFTVFVILFIDYPKTRRVLLIGPPPVSEPEDLKYTVKEYGNTFNP